MYILIQYMLNYNQLYLKVMEKQFIYLISKKLEDIHLLLVYIFHNLDHYSIIWCKNSNYYIGKYLVNLLNRKTKVIQKSYKKRMNITESYFNTSTIPNAVKYTFFKGYNPIKFDKLPILYKLMFYSFQLQINVIPSTLLIILLFILCNKMKCI